ncbi:MULTISPECIES: hypothetical protein [unclassified Bordetella]|uniref:hypothetical protein n=1 Tax=unclassified Bordetella TaxID=2630031 RepID=UPI001327CA1E|nr:MULTISPECIES: hypothetical protein [unclassified Bordetella]MVW70392.1 hypothetical protein [Bordetella sp. 15P40C-2]MVW78668.1 hypothetical protein [Bordetella sp. 02P26C-1]
MTPRILALPIIAAGMVLAGCTHHGNYDQRSDYDRSQMQNTTAAPPPASMDTNNSNSAGPRYPNTGGSR